MIKNNSCLSKVLIAGGYSILFEGNKGFQVKSPFLTILGLVLSTSACYNSKSEFTLTDKAKEQSFGEIGSIEIESVGFNTTWKYTMSMNNNETNQFSIKQESI